MRRILVSMTLALNLAGVLSLAGCATSPTGRSQLMIVPESYAISSSAQAYRQEITPMHVRASWTITRRPPSECAP